MKSFIVCTAFVVTAFIGLPAQEKALGDKAADALENLKRETREIAGSAVRTAREGWNKTKAYLSDDPTEHRAGASQCLEELSREIADVKTRSAETAVGRRPHFQTRLLALSQQLDYVRGELAKLSSLKSQSGYGSARKSFDESLHLLERAIDLAQDELRGSP